MVIHVLKIQDEFYDRIVAGVKDFEIRYNDRDYQVGDYLRFFIGAGPHFRAGIWRVKYVHAGFGMVEKFVVLGIERREDEKT